MESAEHLGRDVGKFMIPIPVAKALMLVKELAVVATTTGTILVLQGTTEVSLQR